MQVLSEQKCMQLLADLTMSQIVWIVQISFNLCFQLSSNRSACEKATEMPQWKGNKNIMTFKMVFYVCSVSKSVYVFFLLTMSCHDLK